MNENTATVLMFALMLVWNVLLWSAFLYMIIHLGTSMWVLLIPAFFTVFPKSKSNERQQD